MKKAIIISGSSYSLRFFVNKNEKYKNFFDEIIYLPDLEKYNLTNFDLVVISSRLNTDFLSKFSDIFIDYLNNKGNIIYLGEMRVNFLNANSFKFYETNFWWWNIKGANLPLYTTNERFEKYLNADDCKWHYHGIFHSNDNDIVYLVNELDEAIILKNNHTFSGNLYLISLDPEYHFGQGFMPKTEYFFDKFMEFVQDDIVKFK